MNNEGKQGTLLLVVGPSGAGKDTLIDAARVRYDSYGHVVFPQRIITRKDTNGEEHIPVSPQEFDRLLTEGGLFMHWEAHGLQYGIPVEAKKQLEQGYLVILNISRAQIAQARSLFCHVIVVQITVNDKVLLQRLIARGRESEQEIKKRFARRHHVETSEAEFQVDNSGELSDAIEVFLGILSKFV